MLETYQSFVVPGVAKYHGGLRSMADVDTIIIHATEGHSADESVGWLNRVLKTGESSASYHYVIAANHQIIRMLRVNTIAYHAGISAIPPKIPGRFDSVNKRSIGIAFDTEDIISDPLTEWQVQAGLWLCVTMCRQYRILPHDIYAHREVAPGRKFDPRPEILDMDIFRARIQAAL